MITNKSIFSFLLILFVTGYFSLSAQQHTLKGIVTDTLKAPLQNANILAIPQTKEENIAFSITDETGNYKLSLKQNTPYTIEISYLGYKKLAETVTLEENTEKNFTLTPSNESLDEVIIKQRLPVSVKEDTITYRTDIFTTGEERKLREVLKKLPGVEVDRDGNVKVNGKKVDKLLVEGKTFFTGDTKLGVNNIPADAVAEVEVLDNYNEIPFLKGLSDSDKMAMNIKLKEDKKRFVFGDVEAGGGVEDRYIVHPSLFYYSPKTSVNVIGDLNNTGKKSFTFQDYLDFEGGFAKLMDDPSGYFNLSNSDFAQSLLNDDFIFNKNTFGAFNIAQQLSTKTNLNAYSIVNASETETQEKNSNTYLINNQITNIENRTTANQAKNLFSLSKLTLNYLPNIKEDLTYETVIKTSRGTVNEQLNSLSFVDTNFVDTKQRPISFDIAQNLSYSKQFSYKHTTTVTANLQFSKNNNDKNWQFSDAVFNNTIPFQSTSPFEIEQKVESKNYSGSLNLKHYWVLNNFNHIYPVAGFNFSKQNYTTIDQQLIDNEINSFQDAGFNNVTQFQLNDTYVGFQYKVKTGDFIFKPGLIYHYYHWDINQFSEKQLTNTKPQLLPELLVKWDIKNSEKVTLKYNVTSRFSDVSFFANRLRLQSFNTLYNGNVDIENELLHKASLRYYKFSLFRGLFINASINYQRRIKSVRNLIVLEGIDQINTSVYTDLPENNLSANVSVSKKINKLKFTLSSNASFLDYSRNINNNIVKYRSNSYGYTAKAETSFNELPNIELGLRQRLSDFSSSTFENTFTQTDPYAILEYDFLNAFILKADYTYSGYKNKANNAKNSFALGNASLYYNKEDSPWAFEVDYNNIFDVNFKNSNSFNQFIINDTRVFIQPRTLLFKILYKL